MRDDVTPPNLGQAPAVYDKNYFFTFFRALEQFQSKFLSPGLIRATTIEADLVDADTVSGDIVNAGALKINGINVVTQAWTPALFFGNQNVGMTYGARTGSLVRIGPFVAFVFDITLTAKGTSVGNSAVGGLPYLSATYGGGGIRYYVAMAGLTGMPWFYMAPASGGVSIVSNGPAAIIGISDANFTNTSRIIGNGWYLA